MATEKELIVKLSADDNLTISIEKAKKATDELTASGDKASKAFGGVGKSVLNLAAATYVFHEIEHAVESVLDVASDLADEFERLDQIQRSIDFAHGPGAGVQVLKDVEEFANRAGFGVAHLQTAAEEISRVLGKNGTPVVIENYVKSVSDLSEQFKLNEQQADQLFKTYAALLNADNPKKLKGAYEEIRAVMPGQDQVRLAEELGFKGAEGIHQLEVAIKKGQVSAHQLDNALLLLGNHGQSVGDFTIEQHGQTLEAAGNKAKNALKEGTEDLAKAIFTPELVKDLNHFSEELLKLVHSDETKQFFKDVSAYINDQRTQDSLKEWAKDIMTIAAELRAALDAVIKFNAGVETGPLGHGIVGTIAAAGDAADRARIATKTPEEATKELNRNFTHQPLAPFGNAPVIAPENPNLPNNGLINSQNLPDVGFIEGLKLLFSDKPKPAPAHASGGLVTGIDNGQAVVAAPGEGLTSIGRGERILSADQAGQYSSSARTLSANSEGDVTPSGSGSGGGTSIGSMTVTIDLSGGAVSNNVISDHDQLKSTVERAVRDAWMKTASQARAQGF